MADMPDQVALVTGGGRGIGAAISGRLAGHGMRVAIGYSRCPDAAKQIADEYQGCTVHQGDIGSKEDCQRVVEEAMEQHERIDVLVNNAGITADKMMQKMEQTWARRTMPPRSRGCSD
jgi:NAD(P)-dependent dehydrogenase (short-subunit alcohol dehydrogenase family)